MTNSKETDSSLVGDFFDQFSDEYQGLIERCVPRYEEMLTALMDYIPPDLHVDNVLELGCGTGNLSVLLAEKFPTATLRFVDISSEMLNTCRQRLGSSHRFIFENVDFRNIEYVDSSFDLVASAISLHHLDRNEKKQLFKRLIQSICPGGIFTYADQFSGMTPDIYDRHVQNWKTQAMKLGASENDWVVWMQHQEEFDHHDSLTDQFDWIRTAGFSSVDCLWRYLLWTVVQARKQFDAIC